MYADSNTTIDNPIRAARLRAGLTQFEVSTRSGVHPSKLSLLERGLRPRPDELIRLAEALGVSTRALATA